jgi:2,3-bisphosphoglycerate-independent phosphoglycerate mutase
MNPVPIIYVSSHPSSQKIQNGILADVAPTILSLMGIAPPPEMTGKNLIA